MYDGGIIKHKIARKTAFLIVVAVAALTAFSALTTVSVGNHEAYVGVTAGNMLSSGDWVVPVFNGAPRLQKTPLNYWLVAACSKITGRVSDFTLRLPNALLAILSAIAIFYFVCEILNDSAALFSAAIWALSLGYIRYSHTGRPEITLTVFVAITMLSFYSAVKTKSRKKQICYMLISWLSFSLAMLAKGPAPLLFIFPALFFYFAIFRRWKIIPKLLPTVGTILFLLIFLPWPIAVFLKYPQAVEIWKNEFFGRAAGEYAAGLKPSYYYFRVMFSCFAPFSIFIPFALGMPFYRVWERKRETAAYMWLWFVVGIVVMSLCGGKRQHYILPAMPAIAILAGMILDDMLFINKAYTRKFAKRFILINIVAIVVFVGVATPSIMKNYKDNHDDVIRDFARNAAIYAEDKPVIAYCKVNASFIYYFGRDVAVFSDIEEILENAAPGDGVIATGDKFKELKQDSRFNLCVTGPDDDRGLFIRI